MEKQWASLLIGIGVEIVVTIFGVVVKTMPMPLAIICGVIGLALILYGLISLIRSKGKGSSPSQSLSKSPRAQQASHAGGDIIQVSGDFVQNFYIGENLAKEVRRVSNESEKPIHVESHNQQGGITAYQVNIQPGDRKLTPTHGQQVKDLLNTLKFKTIEVNAVMGDGEAFRFASQIKNYLTEEGYEVSGINQVVYTTPVQGQAIERPNDAGVVKIIIGNR